MGGDVELSGTTSLALTTQSICSSSPTLPQTNTEVLPVYELQVTVIPFTSVQNNRYERTISATIITTNIRPGLYTRPHYSPPEWEVQINPEGSRYYVNMILQVVTDTPINHGNCYQRVMAGIHELQGLAAQSKDALSQDSELFIQLCDNGIAGDKPTNTCKYYVVDHGSQTEYWYHETNLAQLGITQATSAAHVKYALQEHYWTHVEYFPHRPVSVKSREELINILRHGQLDAMTSTSSTFPYSVEQCEKFIKLLNKSLNTEADIYVTSMTARLWSAISHNRFENFFGEDYARLERGRRIIKQLNNRNSTLMNMTYMILFMVPARVQPQLENLLVDETLYGIHWQHFMRNMASSWHQSAAGAVALTAINGLLLVNPKGPVTKYVGLASTVVSTTSLLASFALMHRYAGSESQSAIEAMDEISKVEHSSLGFQPAAALYSLPRGLLLWSCVLFAIEILSLVLEVATPKWTPFIMVVMLATIFSVALVALAVRCVENAWRRHRVQVAATLPI